MIPQKRDFVYMRIMPVKFWYSCLYYVESVISWKKLSCVDLCWYPDYIFKKKIENEKVFKNNGKPTISC